MKTLFFVIALMTICILNSSAQTVLLKETRFPHIASSIQLSRDRFTVSDSVKLLITITNSGKTSQKLLFDKPFEFPLGTWTVVKNSKGKSMIRFGSREVISSQLYTEEQIEKMGSFYLLQPGQSLSHSYYLSDITSLNTTDGKLPKGKYTLQVNYHNNPSNKLTFNIIH